VRSVRVGRRCRRCGGGLVHGAAVPGFLTEVSELALGEQVDLDLVDGDPWIVVGNGHFDAPDLFAGFVEYRDGFTFPGQKVPDDAGGFDQEGEASAGDFWGRDAHAWLSDLKAKSVWLNLRP